MLVTKGAFSIVMDVPSVRVSLRPSTASRKLCERDSTLSVTVLSPLITMGRTLRLCGATGVRHTVLVRGTMMGPPFDSE